MMDLKSSIENNAISALKDLYNLEVEQVELQQTRKDFEGDLTIVVFPYLRASRKGPEPTAEEIGNALLANTNEISAFNVVKGFLNLSISSEFWAKSLLEIKKSSDFGIGADTDRSIMVEYSSPNTNKPLHLGHVRNNLLGYSVAEILKAAGNKVNKVQIINDRGIHICKSMLAWQKFGNGDTPESTGLKGDKLVGNYYVRFEKEYRAEVMALAIAACKSNGLSYEDPVARKKQLEAIAKEEEWTENEKQEHHTLKAIIEKAEQSTVLLQQAREMLKKWEQGDAETVKLWETMNGWVYDGFEKTYERLGVDFDKYYYESETYLLGKAVVEEGLAKGVFEKDPDGSVWIDLRDEGLDRKILLRSDGTSVYMTQDIGTAIQRSKDFTIDGMIYTVGNEQDYHFKVLFLTLDKLGYAWAKNLYHLSYGMVDLPTGKMKSREGTVVDADDLIDEMEATAAKISEELGKTEGMSEEEKKKLYHMVGMGALKYYILRVDPRKRMMFNPDESIEFQGNTGPFIQYTHARIKSLLRMGQETNFNLEDASGYNQLQASERELIKCLMLFPEIVSEAAGEYSPAVIANYAYELVKLYNAFYQDIPILKDEDKSAVAFRLALSGQVADVIKTAMHLLGIDVPERM